CFDIGAPVFQTAQRLSKNRGTGRAIAAARYGQVPLLCQCKPRTAHSAHAVARSDPVLITRKPTTSAPAGNAATGRAEQPPARTTRHRNTGSAKTGRRRTEIGTPAH